jgi:hypothetical protein
LRFPSTRARQDAAPPRRGPAGQGVPGGRGHRGRVWNPEGVLSVSCRVGRAGWPRAGMEAEGGQRRRQSP